jgi:hypothetical protein
MPSPETFQRKQKMVLWPFLGNDQYGQPVTDEPREILVRWEQTSTQARDAQGKVINIDGKIVVAESIAIGGEAWLGSLESWYGRGSAGQETGLMTITAILEDAKDIKGRKHRRVLGLSRHQNAPSQS